MIEAISGVRSSRSPPRLQADHRRPHQIKVPRDAGTCTKCPMEVRIQSADGPWRCQVRLRRETDENGKPLPSIQETTFGGPVGESQLVEAILQRAQLAILNPSVRDSTKFVSLDLKSIGDGLLLGSKKQLDFSSNLSASTSLGRTGRIWRLSTFQCVHGFGLAAEMAFLTPPGSQGIVANGEQRTIELVKSLVTKYIKGNSLILVALTIGGESP